ncbi:hypothetical protein ACRCMW_00485 [Enterobacter chengduensis]|jgi:hypothetical protein|uniref:hypothetical protein n=2 Tax=Enterobacter chengduensis TaxID=2494701 RepID=UPI003D951226
MFDSACFSMAKQTPFRSAFLSIPRNIKPFWSSLATPNDFASGSAYTVALDAVALTETENASIAMILSDFSNFIFIPSFVRYQHLNHPWLVRSL